MIGLLSFVKRILGIGVSQHDVAEDNGPTNTIEILVVDEDGKENWEEIPFDTEFKVKPDGSIYFFIDGEWIYQDDIKRIAY